MEEKKVTAKVVAVCSSDRKGIPKTNIGQGYLRVGYGLAGDAHGGDWHRQISLLAMESIEKMKALGLPDLKPGDFAENLTTEGLNLHTLPIGTRLKAGETLLEVTQIGKECHHGCAIFQKVGKCIMPKEGIFAKIITGGWIKEGDEIQVVPFVAKVGILTASDKGSRGEREDKSGEVIKKMVVELPGEVVEYALVPDEKEEIKKKLIGMIDEQKVDLILTTGGTGLGPRDVTPDATLEVIERIVPGIAEVMRAESMKKTSRAMLSRAVAGTRGKALLINLPGSPKAVYECLEVILPALPHALEILQGRGGECAR